MITSVPAGGYDWNIRREGAERGLPLLLLHGFTGCAAFWDEVIEALTPVFHVTAVDLPGHGGTRTSGQDGTCTMSAVAAGLAELLERIGTPRTHLWGYSMGGRLALYFALHHPDHVDRLILESASPGIADPEARQQRRSEDNARAHAIERGGVEAFIREWIALPLFATQRELAQTRQEQALVLRLQHDAAGLAASLREMGTGVQPALHARLRDLQAPTLILAGARDAKFSDIGQAMAREISDSVLRIIPDVGHAPHWERPDLSARLAQAFLQDKDVPDLCANPALSQ